MRGVFVFMGFLFSCRAVQAQKKPGADNYDKIFTKVESLAGPDMQQWNAYLKKASILAPGSGIPPGVYKITVSFIIDKNGNLADAKAKNNPGYGLAGKAAEIILNYNGVWHPASQCGRNVKSYKEEVVQFVLSN